MKQKAIVVSENGRHASVKVDRASMCDGCHKEGCGDSCALYKIFGAKTSFVADAQNRCGAKIGDHVIVEASDKRVNISAFFVFILPIILAGAAYFLTPFIENDGIRMLVSVGVFVIYFAVLALTESIRKKRGARIEIVEIVSSADNID